MVSNSSSPAKKALLITFISICFIAVIALGTLKTFQLSDTQSELAATQTELASTTTDLSNTEDTLAATGTELSLAKTDLSTTQTELSDTQNELQTASATLEDTTQKLKQTETDYEVAYNELVEQRDLSVSLQNSLDNLQANYNRFTAGFSYVLKDPTYQEVKAFIAADTTDMYQWVDDIYTSINFAFDIKVHALQQKIRCAYVLIRYAGDLASHYIVAFNTTDRGLIYIEPQTDEEANLQRGWHYWSQCVIPTPGHYYINPTTYDDTVERFNVIW